MNSRFVITAAMTLFLVLCSVQVQGDEVCLPVRREDSNQDTTSTSGAAVPPQVIQGRPGKTGAPGFPGNPGMKGDRGIAGPPGNCVCDVENEIATLQAEIQQLRVSVCSVEMRSGGQLHDEKITESSAWSDAWRGRYGRLDNPNPGSGSSTAWVPASDRQRAGEWVQVDLDIPTRVVAVVTQGRSERDYRVTSYKIQYGNCTDDLQTVQRNNSDEIFPGNTDSSTYVINEFPSSIVARYFRLVVHTFNSNYISLRMDYLTC